MNETVLLVEDDDIIADLVNIHLSDLGFKVDRANDGQTGLQMALNNEYSMILLDIMLPSMDGLEVCRNIRIKNQAVPIIMLTARSEELDKVLGLELGADDYITKPFSIRELIARIKVIRRRLEYSARQQSDEARQEKLEFGELQINIPKRRVILEGRSIELTAKEFDLLTLFASNPGRTYSRQDLLNLVWGYQFSGYDHTVNSHINRLRNKLEDDPSNPRYIRTLWGVGYRFMDVEEVYS